MAFNLQSVKRIKLKRGAQNVLLIAAAALAGFGGAFVYDQTSGTDKTGENASVSRQAQVVSDESDLNAAIATNVSDSVVSINVESSTPASRFFYGYTSESAGTGIIISSDGYIITNKHVIPEGATKVTVTLGNGTEYNDVEIVGRDPRSSVDIAFLKIKDVKDLKAAKLGDSSNVRVGEKVVAIGNALGQYQNTVTSGIISGLGRPVTAGDETGSESLTNLLQTDAAINSGNSGGPLVNVNSEVIGINTAVATGDAQNIGFAIPIDDVKGLINSVLAKGKLEVPYLGVRYVDLNEDIASQLDLERDKGAYIYASGNQKAIVSGSPAEKAGLQKGDIIIKINTTNLDEDHGLAATLSKYSVGEGVNLTIVRDGKEKTILVTLEAAPTN